MPNSAPWALRSCATSVRISRIFRVHRPANPRPHVAETPAEIEPYIKPDIEPGFVKLTCIRSEVEDEAIATVARGPLFRSNALIAADSKFRMVGLFYRSGSEASLFRML